MSNQSSLKLVAVLDRLLGRTKGVTPEGRPRLLRLIGHAEVNRAVDEALAGPAAQGPPTPDPLYRVCPSCLVAVIRFGRFCQRCGTRVA